MFPLVVLVVFDHLHRTDGRTEHLGCLAIRNSRNDVTLASIYSAIETGLYDNRIAHS